MVLVDVSGKRQKKLSMNPSISYSKYAPVVSSKHEKDHISLILSCFKVFKIFFLVQRC